MQSTAVLAIKFVTCLIAFTAGLDLFFNATLAEIISFSVFVTAVTFILGEQIILPQMGV